MSERKRVTSYLAYRVAGGEQRVVVWDTVDLRVGRRKTQDIVIPDPEVSREHACFRREKDRHLVEDLGTAIGTWVNGEQITRHELQPGDVVRIGAFEFTFGKTEQTIRPGGNARYASELKSHVAAPSAAAGSGRTMLGFDLGDSGILSAATDVPPALNVARAVSADGTLEEVEGDDPLGLSLHPDGMGGAGAVRDLDLELTDPVTAPAGSPQPLSDLRPPAAGASAARASDPARGATPPRMTLVLEVEPATFEIASLVAALYGQEIGHPLLRIRIKKPDLG